MRNRTGEYIGQIKVVILRQDGIAQITLLNLPSSAPTYPMSISAVNFSNGEKCMAEFYKKGNVTKKLFYKEVV
jgi:hypothetical protein